MLIEKTDFLLGCGEFLLEQQRVHRDIYFDPVDMAVCDSLHHFLMIKIAGEGARRKTGAAQVDSIASGGYSRFESFHIAGRSQQFNLLLHMF